MYRLGLNQTKSDNYMFLDFEAPLCLSVSRNTGVVERLTPSILSAIKSRTLILLEGELPEAVTAISEDGKTKSSITTMPDVIHARVTSEEGTTDYLQDTDGFSVIFSEPEKIVEEVVEEEPAKKTTTKRSTKKAKTE